MGSYISKLFDHEEPGKISELNSSALILENRDTCTPQPQKKKSLIDPRSATLGITRTPIEVLSTPQKEPSKMISSVPKYLKRKPYLETNFDVTPPRMTLEKCLDPRSPSVDVPRTPIMVETLQQTDTPKNHTSNHYNKTNLLSEMHQKMLGLDPRSPATNFDRTPILKPKSLESRETCSQENLNISTNEIKMQPSRLSYCETTTSFNITEIDALPDVVTCLNSTQSPVNKTYEVNCTSSSGNLSRNSIVTVLRKRNETSLDDSLESSSSDFGLKISKIENKVENFEERLLAHSDKIIDNVISIAMKDFENKINETENNIISLESSSDFLLESSKLEDRDENFEERLIADSDKIIDNVLNIAMKDFESKINAAENKIKIWRDTLSPEIDEDSEYDSECDSESCGETVSPNEKLVIEYDDDDFNVIGTVKKTEIKRNVLKEKRKSKNFKSEVHTKKFFSPVKKQSNEVKKPEILKNRTPLRNRSNSNSKSQGLDRKSPQMRRKALLSSTKLQENTPPRVKKAGLTSKFNKTQWDGDSTIII